jgi:PPM family protein phosphatase
VARIESYALSFVGRRNGNEDSCTITQLGESNYFIAVADGMGGAAAGELASETIITSSSESIKKTFGIKSDAKDLKKYTTECFIASQGSLAELKQHRPDLSSMGSTLSCMLVAGDKFVVGNVGDSRVYLLSKGILQQITIDHNYIQELIRSGGEKPNESVVARYSHYITRTMDGGSDLPDIFPLDQPYFTFQDGDVLLICSDGLISDKASENSDWLKDIILGTKSLKSAVEQLIARAFLDGSQDNITVVLFSYGVVPRARSGIKTLVYPPSKMKTTSVQRFSRQSAAATYRWIILSILLLALGVLLMTSLLQSPHKGKTQYRQTEQAHEDKSTYRKEITEWIPFHSSDCFSLANDSLQWSEYPDPSVRGYKIIFNNSVTVNSINNYFSLKTIKGLKPGIYSIRIEALLDKGSVESANYSVQFME